ncbi:BQ5605_C014g07689 [Microbotryum silenes-dioicae]|uniref:BQ5605_C014g07689 protein n=1 Tax=Microbotryum silenes-dioicae TaxID=796604 RepID=A0A2X0MP16_9BASI|nr:BQ5605_C014g07689 [Microbotryum silenes-dioicae]
MSSGTRDGPPHTDNVARRVKLELPTLNAGFKSRDVTRWLAGCEDAIESAEWNYGGKIAAVHLIREAGCKMEGEGADWYIDCRDKVKALKSWPEFAQEVKARFINEKTGLEAKHAFYNAHQTGTLSDFVATLIAARGQAGSIGGTQVISDELFKDHLLHRCDELLYLRATASPSFDVAKFTMNQLVAYLQSLWEAITLERATTGVRRMGLRNDQVRQEQNNSAAHQTSGRPMAGLDRTPRDKALHEGRCFHCDVHGHIAADCPSKPGTSLTPAPSRPTPGPRMVAAIREYQESGDSTAFVGISSDSEEDDARWLAFQTDKEDAFFLRLRFTPFDPFCSDSESVRLESDLVPFTDLIPSLTVNDVVHSDPDSMLGAASDYFERVYEDRPIDDAALKAIIDGLASTRLSPADSLKLEEAYPLEEMTKAQEAFLCAVGLGPKARQWYQATYTNQSASIFLNGWLSATFDILSGVRQGDPLAPSLFVLAIEGFACQIRLRVKGIDIAGLQNVRELLFANDACCALHNLSDLDHLNQAIELYERASASKLSNVKSFLYPLGAFRDRSITPDLGTWRLSDSQFRYLGIQVGVEIAEDAGWEDVKASTIARIRSVPMYNLPYAAKCSIINIYCYTKILYYSQFLPAPKSVVKEIEEAAMLAIHGRASDGTQQRPKVSRSRLCTPLDHGGFGLIDLPRRLAINHAKWVFQLRAPDGCFTRHLFDIRIRLQAPNEPTPFTLSRPAPNQHRCPWIWIWWAYFCHPPPKWDHAVRKTTKLLPARWVRYFEAWVLVTTLNPPELSKSQNLEQWATHVLYFPAGHGIQLSVNPTLFRGPDGEVMTPSLFVNASKRHQVFIFPPIFPKGHQKVFDLPEQCWNAWWKALRKVCRVHSDAEDTGHLLSLGSLHPGSQVASPTSPHPNNRSTSCVMCLSEAPECLVHLAVGCPFARRLWSALSPTPHPVFVDFVCPVVSRSERRLVELRVLFFHSIWKLRRRRRFSSDLLEPITETEFEGL